MPITDFKSNPKREGEGFWLELSKNKDGTIPRFLLARMSPSNRKYVTTLESEVKPHRRAIELGTLAEDAADELNIKIFCRSILLGWEHIQPKDDGIEVPYSESNAIDLLNKPEWQDLVQHLSTEARKAANYRDKAREVELKN